MKHNLFFSITLLYVALEADIAQPAFSVVPDGECNNTFYFVRQIHQFSQEEVKRTIHYQLKYDSSPNKALWLKMLKIDLIEQIAFIETQRKHQYRFDTQFLYNSIQASAYFLACCAFTNFIYQCHTRNQCTYQDLKHCLGYNGIYVYYHQSVTRSGNIETTDHYWKFYPPKIRIMHSCASQQEFEDLCCRRYRSADLRQDSLFGVTPVCAAISCFFGMYLEPTIHDVCTQDPNQYDQYLDRYQDLLQFVIELEQEEAKNNPYVNQSQILSIWYCKLTRFLSLRNSKRIVTNIKPMVLQINKIFIKNFLPGRKTVEN